VRTRKRLFRLHAGPFDGKKVFLSEDSNTTLTFGLHGFYGRYVLTGGSFDMSWHEQQSTIARKPVKTIIGKPVRKTSRARRTLDVILAKAA